MRSFIYRATSTGRTPILNKVRCRAAGQRRTYGCAASAFLSPTPIARTSLLRLFGPLPSYILYSVAPLLARGMLSAKMHLMMCASTS